MMQNDNIPSNDSGESLTYEEVEELLPGFALGALDVHEMQAVEQYLQKHEKLLKQRNDLELSSQAIAYSAAPQTLPGSVKSRLMERVRADAKVKLQTVQPQESQTQATPVRRLPFGSSQPAAPVPAAAPRRPQRSGRAPLFPEEHRSQSWGGWAQGLIGVAAVAATAVLLFANWQLQSESATLNQKVAAVQQQLDGAQQTIEERDAALATLQTQSQESATQIASLQTQFQQIQRDSAELQNVNNNLQQTVAQQSQQINTLATANRLLTLAGLGQATQANGTFFVSDGTVVLSIRGLPPVPDDKTYQLWYIPEGGAPEPANLFQVQTGDSTLLTFTIPSDVTTFASVGVSIEPAGGSQAPTDIVLLST